MGGKSTKVKQSNEPPKWAKPLFEKSAGEVQRLYDSGSGFNIWEGPTIADQSRSTLQGIQGLQDASSSPALNALSGSAVQGTNRIISGGGYDPYSKQAQYGFAGQARGDLNPSLAGMSAINPVNAATRAATAGYGGAAAGGLNTDAGNYARGLFGALTGPLASEQNLQGHASGQYLKEGNPFFRDLIAKSAQEAGEGVNAMFSGAGRYGGGANQDVLGETMGDIYLKGYADDYNRANENMFRANQMLDSAAQGRAGLGLGAIGAMAGADAQNAQAQLAGLGGLAGQGQSIFGNALTKEQALFGAGSSNADRQAQGYQNMSTAGNQAIGNIQQSTQQLPTVMQSSLFAPTTALQAGSIQEQYSQNLLNDEIRKFYENDMQDWTRLGALQAGAAGAAGPYGTSVTTQRQPFNPFGMIGGLMGLFA